MWTDVAGVRTARSLAYDTREFPFAKWLAANLFKVPRLDKLHEQATRFRPAGHAVSVLSYDDNLRLRDLMQQLEDKSYFYRLYHRFAVQVIGGEFGGKIAYSNHPKMRVHLAGTPTVSKWHRDVDVTKRPDQINVWLPFTDSFGGNSLWIETDYGRGDYRPVDVRYGQALLFDGGFLEHGTVTNDTNVTRISLDFRFSIRAQTAPEVARSFFEGRPAESIPSVA
ncbi:MAG TPA: hypothetical protein VHU83_11895 [Bryobacteraceae bacterium]|jgi:hypothetical protein|nr:hypothetical protein [Bryobacteraceae bacterium]